MTECLLKVQNLFLINMLKSFSWNLVYRWINRITKNEGKYYLLIYLFFYTMLSEGGTISYTYLFYLVALRHTKQICTYLHTIMNDKKISLGIT